MVTRREPWSCQKVSRLAPFSQSTRLPRKAKSETSISAVAAASSELASRSGQKGFE